MMPGTLGQWRIPLEVIFILRSALGIVLPASGFAKLSGMSATIQVVSSTSKLPVRPGPLPLALATSSIVTGGDAPPAARPLLSPEARGEGQSLRLAVGPCL